jgi:flavodoxin I
MGLLAGELQKTKAQMVGQVSPEGYDFDESMAVSNGMFIGLPLDEDFEPELTQGRVISWLQLLSKDLSF